MSASYFTSDRLRALAQRLGERDWQVIQRVAGLRFVSGDQLTRLCFADSSDPAMNARAARRALLRLTRLGVLVRLPRSVGGVRAGSSGFVYRLGLGGHRLAIERGLLPEWFRWRRSLTPGTLFVRHTLLVAELHTRLIESERAGRFELMALNAEPWCHRTYDGYGSQRLTLKPDSYVRLGVGPYEDSYFIEVDRGTEGSRAIARQLQAYAAYYRSGDEQRTRGVFPKVLWLAPTAERAGVIAGCLASLPGDERGLFAAHEFAQALPAMLDPDLPPMI